MDDGFDWLDTLPPDLRRDIWLLMECVAEGEHTRVDALVPGLVARARAEERPWVEVFARNFALRSLVLHREDTRIGLGQAVELLDRAHRPDTRDCPQTICTAHAVCAAYGLRDAAGFIDERLAVSSETLSRVDPRRVCWLCISNEHADALLDAGRPQAALDFIEGQQRARVAAGAEVDPDDFGLRRTAAHLLAGRLAEAHRTLDGCQTDARGASWQRTWRQWKALVFASEGRAAEAAPMLSSVAEILDDGGFRLHLRTLPLLYGKAEGDGDAALSDGMLSDDEIVRQMCLLGRACIERGGGAGVEALIWAAERLLGDGEPTLARAALDGAREGLDLLRQTAAFEARIDQLAARLDAAPPPAPDPDGRDFETGLANLRVDPGAPWLEPLMGAARAFGLPELARALAEQTRAAAPADEDVFRLTAEALIGLDDAALDALLTTPPPTDDGPHLAGWFRALAAERRGESPIPHLAPVAAARPGWAHVSDRLGGLYFEAGRYAEADAVWSATAALGAAGNPFHWRCVCAATAARDWPRVRALAAESGFPVPPGDGDFQADYGLMRVMFEDDARPYFASRNGPLTARVLSLRTPGAPQHHGDRVLFHPDPLNADELDADADALRLHPVMLTLDRAGALCVDLDGRHPGEAAVESLRAALTAAGCFHQFGAGEEYVVRDPETGEDHPGLYLLVAARPDQLAEVEAIFAAVDGPGPRVWSALLEQSGRPDEAAQHHATAQAWGMV